MKPYCFALDRIAPVEEARIHASDISVIRGYGIFDFLRTQDYCPLFLADYLDRFITSAQHTRLPLAYTKEELTAIIYALIAKNDLREGGIRLVLTGGRSENHFAPGQSQLFIFNEDLFFPDATKYIQGVKLLPIAHVRAVATIKMTNYAFPVYLSGDWKATGAEDVLYYHEGFISESSRSNIFIVKDGSISTPNHDILYGITRKQVIRVAENVAERPISLDELLRADEVFMTSTTKRILPVTTLADKKVNNGRVGPVTRHLMERFRQMETRWIAEHVKES